MSINKIILVGNVGTDPKRITTQYGVLVEFSLATSESWKDKNSGEKKEKTEWHKIIVKNSSFTKDRGICDYIGKGSKLYIEGSIETSKFNNKNGQEQYITKIVAKTISLLNKMTESVVVENEDNSEDIIF
jgi:single-strand DNA-binding protein